jgi:3-isopropylmalate dehydrogenase
MNKNIAILSGDGIGSEIVHEAIEVMRVIAKKYNHIFTFIEGLVGSIAIEKTGDPFPQATEKLCLQSDAILFGAIGDPKYDNDPTAKVRPEQGLLRMRKTLGLYANIRPIFLFPTAIDKSPLKPEIIANTDFIVVRELIGGIYFGKQGRNKDRTKAYDTAEYSTSEIERVVRFAFKIAEKRRKKLTVVDKANVLETSRLWRETTQKIAKEYTDISLDFMFVDNAAQQIIKNPSYFDVIVTENMFGDILTDEASVITGSLGMLPSASIGEKTSLYEPIHGSFPKAAGQDRANPIATILSAAMMLEMSFGLIKERNTIYAAVEKVLATGFGTRDIAKDPEKILGTKAFGERIRAELT